VIASLERGLNILSTLAEHGGARVDTLAADLDLPLSTTYRYMRTLVRAGYLDEVDGTYVPGGRLLRLARLSDRHDHLVRLAKPSLRRLAEATQETVLFTVRAGTLALCLDRVESLRPVRLSFDVGALRPLHAGASAKILLAFAPDAVVAEILHGRLESFTPRTPTAETLPGQLLQIRGARQAVTYGELDPHAVGLAVPVLLRDGVVYALSVAGPASRLTRPAVRAALPHLHEAERTLTARLGPAMQVPQ